MRPAALVLHAGNPASSAADLRGVDVCNSRQGRRPRSRRRYVGPATPAAVCPTRRSGVASFDGRVHLLIGRSRHLAQVRKATGEASAWIWPSSGRPPGPATGSATGRGLTVRGLRSCLTCYRDPHSASGRFHRNTLAPTIGTWDTDGTLARPATTAKPRNGGRQSACEPKCRMHGYSPYFPTSSPWMPRQGQIALPPTQTEPHHLPLVFSPFTQQSPEQRHTTHSACWPHYRPGRLCCLLQDFIRLP